VSQTRGYGESHCNELKIMEKNGEREKGKKGERGKGIREKGRKGERGKYGSEKRRKGKIRK